MTEDNRITRIRSVLSDPMLDEAMMLDQANAILDADPAEPRVFLPGDTVPAGVAVMLDDGSLLEGDTVDEKQTEQDGPAVELLGIPTREQWQVAVDRAKAEREENRDG